MAKYTWPYHLKPLDRKEIKPVNLKGYQPWIFTGRTDAEAEELGQIPEDGEGQGGLACYSPWGHKESDTIGQLNNNHLKSNFFPS